MFETQPLPFGTNYANDSQYLATIRIGTTRVVVSDQSRHLIHTQPRAWDRGAHERRHRKDWLSDNGAFDIRVPHGTRRSRQPGCVSSRVTSNPRSSSPSRV